MRRISITILAALAMSISTAARADGYLLASFGSAEDVVFEETAGAFKVSAGTMVNDVLGVEFGFVYLGSFDVAFVEITQLGVAGSINPTVNIGESASLFFKLGLFSWSFVVDDGFSTAEDDGIDPFFGVGLSVDISEKAQLVIEYEGFEVSDGDVDLVSAGVRFKF